MWIPVLSRRLGQGDKSASIPLWRDPEVSVADWLTQCIIPHILPLKKATRKIKSNGGDIKPIESVRRMWENTNKSHDKQFAAWRTIQLQVPRPDGSKVSILIQVPPRAAPDANSTAETTSVSGDSARNESDSWEELPLLVWFHGGGYTIGTHKDTYGATLANDLLKQYGVRFAYASVDYSLAPEHAFPGPALDGLLALEFLNKKVLEGRLAEAQLRLKGPIHVGGISAGAGLAASVVAEGVRRGVRMGSFFCDSPMLDPSCECTSYQRNSTTTVCPVEWLHWSWGVYLPEGSEKVAPELRGLLPPLASGCLPIPTGAGRRTVRAAAEEASHPPTLVCTATADPLQDEGREYTRRLGEAGVEVTHAELHGSHVMAMMFDKKGKKKVLAEWVRMFVQNAQAAEH